jgi:hypothetical protein
MTLSPDLVAGFAIAGFTLAATSSILNILLVTYIFYLRIRRPRNRYTDSDFTDDEDNHIVPYWVAGRRSRSRSRIQSRSDGGSVTPRARMSQRRSKKEYAFVRTASPLGSFGKHVTVEDMLFGEDSLADDGPSNYGTMQIKGITDVREDRGGT